MKKARTKETITTLLNAIQANGLDNVSLLSEEAGIPVESARYMIWHELPKHFVSFHVDVDLESLGLKRWMIEFTPSKSSTSERRMQNGILGSAAGVVYSARVVPGDSFLTLLAIPVEDQYKLWMELEQLSRAGLIRSYSLKEIRFMRSVSFNPSFYSFGQSQWSFSWADVEKYEQQIRHATRLPSFSFSEKQSESRGHQVDYKDILILKEFERRIPRSISGLARYLDQDSYNIRYHYNQHARFSIRSYCAGVIPNKPQSRCVFVFLLSQEGDDKDELALARSIALSLPFTVSEWMMKKEYGWSVSCPGESANEVLHHVNRKFARVNANLRFLMLDSSSEFRGTIPWQIFDKETDRWNYAPNISAAKPYASFQELRNVCKYGVDNRCSIDESNPKECAISLCPFARQ